jgi:hypothetical protein
LLPAPPLARLERLFSIRVTTRPVIFVDDDWRWWRVWLNENADASTDVRLAGEFPAQSAAQYPNQESQQKINGSEQEKEGVIVNASIQVFQSRRF